MKTARKLRRIATVALLVGSGVVGGTFIGYGIASQFYRGKLNTYQWRMNKEFTEFKKRIELLERRQNRLQEKVDSLSSEIGKTNIDVARLDVRLRRQQFAESDRGVKGRTGGPGYHNRVERRKQKEREYRMALERWKKKPWIVRIFTHKPDPKDYGLNGYEN